MSTHAATRTIGNVIAGEERGAASGETFEKFAPATGELLSLVARSQREDVDAAVDAAAAAQPAWARETPAARGALLRRIAQLLERDAEEIAAVVAAETGKSPKDALGETGAAIEMGYFVAGEGRRLYGKTTTSAIPNRQAMILRQPLGVAGLIIAANTPIANVAWKVFPALVCGNAAVLKASEDTPETALAFARLAAEAGLPDGRPERRPGLGPEAGQPLVEDPRVAVVSFTGSTAVGRMIARVGGERLAKVCLELGGKNPLIVCDDADLEKAADAAALSAFSNAGQRCAAGSRIIVFAAVYDEFQALLLERTQAQRVGPGDEHDFGPVINERQLEHMLRRGARGPRGGRDGARRRRAAAGGDGYFMAPTLIEGARLAVRRGALRPDHDAASGRRLRRGDRSSPTTRRTASPPRSGRPPCTAARSSSPGSRSGVASVNGPTYGSEPHMPFGGLRDSGTGWREAGTEAIDIYSDLKTVYVHHDPSRV